ncbi:MAG TPA: tripartite tricarboxylate transporter TctB family protein [Devosia sp.]|nr:tripartite tricarboxylate transporter TctB family protein [Devosia sp.]
MKTAIPMDSVLGVLFAAGGTAILISALGYPPIAGMVVGPGLFPAITGAAMAILGVVLALQGWFVRDLEPVPVEGAPEDAPEPLITPFAIGIVAAILAVILVMPMLGFLIAGVLFAIVIVKLSNGGWLAAIIFSPIATYAIYALFTYGFRVPLPRGLLG